MADAALHDLQVRNATTTTREGRVGLRANALTQMDHSIVTQWGGRTARYAASTGELHRAHDPFASMPIVFGQAIHYEAWLSARFDPRTLAISHKRTVISARIGERDRKATATFMLTRRDTTVHYVLVVKHEPPAAPLAALNKVAEATGASVIVRRREEIRAEVDLFWRLERLRQCAVIHLRMGAELDRPIIEELACGAKGVSQLCSALGCVDSQLCCTTKLNQVTGSNSSGRFRFLADEVALQRNHVAWHGQLPPSF